MPKGVSERYKVVDRQTGEEVKGLFVLDPINDPHARPGLMAYARSIEAIDFHLASNLTLYMLTLEAGERRNKPKISGSFEIPDWLIELAKDNDADEDETSDS